MANTISDFITDRYNDPNRVPVTKAANNLYEIVRSIQKEGQRKLLTKHGKAIAAITPLSEIAIVDELMSGREPGIAKG